MVHHACVHRVRRWQWRVRTASAAQAFEWRSALRAEADSALSTALEAACEAVARAHGIGDDVLRLSRVELRLSSADPQQLVAELPQALERALLRAVEQAVPAPSTAPDAEEGTGAWDLATATPLAEESTTALDDTAARRLPPPRAVREALLHLLDMGQLPWDWSGRERADVKPVLREAAHALLEEVGDDRSAWSVWARARPERVQRWALWLDAAALDAAFAAHTALDLAAELPPLGSAASPLARALWQLLVSVGPATAAVDAPPDTTALAAQATTPARARGASVPAREADHSADHAAPDLTAREEGLAAERASDAAPQPERWLASDAGLVLLHPFLPMLFEATGLLAPHGRALLPERLPQAAVLLHWLVHGRLGAQEHELTLCKLLLGLSPHQLLLPAGKLDEQMFEEGTALLLATIGHWGTLGQTGVDGLRVSFLQRRGLLSAATNGPGWRLKMAREAFDVLLSRLPWAVSLVRLPWMPWTLTVEWDSP